MFYQSPLLYLPLRLLTIRWLLFAFGFLVLTPINLLPQSDLGASWPTGDLPSPQSWGWSFKFIVDPLTVGLIPSHLVLPALPRLIKL